MPLENNIEKSLVACLSKNTQIILIVAARCYKVVIILWNIYFPRKIAKSVNCHKMARSGHSLTACLLVHNAGMNTGLYACAEM